VLTEISVSTYPFIILTVGMGLAIIMLGATTYGFFRTVYTIKNGRLHAWSPFATVDLDINDIIKVEQTRVPIYFKGFGGRPLFRDILHSRFWLDKGDNNESDRRSADHDEGGKTILDHSIGSRRFPQDRWPKGKWAIHSLML